ncbi:hypothetical protein M758_11G023800 [Ceratodon purpureus]|nr:hypothetical protein M758_11G023800 [Ceratodon purpureus]
MEESIANPWLEDLRDFARTDDEYFPAGQNQLESRSLQPSAASHLEFSNSSSPTFLCGTAEPYAYFDPYLQTHMQTMAFKGVQVHDSFRDKGEGPLSQALEQLLPCSIHGEVYSGTSGEPLHQLPGWTQHNGMMEDWNPSSSCSLGMESSSTKPAKLQINHEPWMMEMPSLCPTSSLEMSPVNHLFHPDNMFTSFEDHAEQSQRPRSASYNSNEPVAVNRKAAARKNRILLRQKSAPHQRVTSQCAVQDANGSGSPRPSKKAYSNKIPQELLMNINVQGRNMDPLRFILHKVLQPSDVNNLGRIVISKKEAEAHLPYLSLKEGIFITMEDFDTSDLWTFRYRFWPNIKSRMYLLESTGEFIRAHQLKKGDIVILWRNNLRDTFVIQALVLPNGCASTTQSPDHSAAVDLREEAREDDIKGKTKARRG